MFWLTVQFVDSLEFVIFFVHIPVDTSGDKSTWATDASTTGGNSDSSRIINGNSGSSIDYWNPMAENFAWISVDMQVEQLVLEVKIYTRVFPPPNPCCKERVANLEVRVGNEDPAAMAEAGKRLR